MSEPRVVKRYANRKLYDTQRSRYVTLDQIAEMIRAGQDVKIIDNTSKDDLTSITLAQIIFEQEKKQNSFLPLSATNNRADPAPSARCDALPATRLLATTRRL